jgi:hypothetical protein
MSVHTALVAPDRPAWWRRPPIRLAITLSQGPGKRAGVAFAAPARFVALPGRSALSVARAKSVGGLAEPAGEVVVQVLLIVADPGDVAVGA